MPGGNCRLPFLPGFWLEPCRSKKSRIIDTSLALNRISVVRSAAVTGFDANDSSNTNNELKQKLFIAHTSKLTYRKFT
jgi:hypothetical protein